MNFWRATFQKRPSRRELRMRALRLKFVLLDVDGVLTDGSVGLSGESGELKFFHVSDGIGIIALKRLGLKVGFLTGRLSESVKRRGEELKVDELIGNAFGKEQALEDLMAKYGLAADQVEYVGDDLHDLPVLKRVGLPIGVSNAREEVKRACVFVTRASGGRGAVREVAEWILEMRGEKGRLIVEFGLTSEEKKPFQADRQLKTVEVGFPRPIRRGDSTTSLGVVTTSYSTPTGRVLRVEQSLLGEFVGTANPDQSIELLKRLNALTNPSGTPYARLVTTDGYEPWWFVQNQIYDYWLIPYVKYIGLLTHLNAASSIHLRNVPDELAKLVKLNLAGRTTQLKVSHSLSRRIGARIERMSQIPTSLFQQVVTLGSLIWCTRVSRRRTLVYAVDAVGAGSNHDVRVEKMYSALRRSRTPFVEFMWSPRGSRVFRNFFARARPCIYLQALDRISPTRISGQPGISVSDVTVQEADSDLRFLHLLATNVGIPMARKSGALTKVMGKTITALRVERALFFDDYRHANELSAACKQLALPTIGVQHGLFNKLSVGLMAYGARPERSHAFDRYYLWSSVIRQQLVSQSSIYTEANTCVGGPSRRLHAPTDGPTHLRPDQLERDSPVKALFVVESYDPDLQQRDVTPFLEALLNDPTITVYARLRPGQRRMPFRLRSGLATSPLIAPRSLRDALAMCDVVIGSWSTVLVESIYQRKPVVIFPTSLHDDPHQLGRERAAIRAARPSEIASAVRLAATTDPEELIRIRDRIWGLDVPDMENLLLGELRVA